jgi:hypothetical protein
VERRQQYKRIVLKPHMWTGEEDDDFAQHEQVKIFCESFGVKYRRRERGQQE